MGNNRSKGTTVDTQSLEHVHRPKQVKFQEIKSSSTNSLFGRSFISLGSQHSVRSASSISRPWSRVSRKRWRESTLTLPYEASKTAWPVSQLESYFLPVFPVNTSANVHNYTIIEEVAKGAFGKVFKVYDVNEKKYYALKVLSKSTIIKENAVHQVKEEVQIQSVCGHHYFIVNSPACWQTKRNLYIVSDFVEGGELFKLLDTYRILPVILVKLYVAQIALVLDFLHNAGVIYRDLKPENLLLDERGDIQLADFGLSKWLPYGNKTKTLCGTLRYMAPEVFNLQPYGHACDWWSLGVIACQMLTGQYPTMCLRSENGDEVDTSEIPGTLPKQVALDSPSKDLLLRLLQVDPALRLRSLRTLQSIAFYKDYSFDDVRNRKVRPKDVLLEYFPGGPFLINVDVVDVPNFDVIL